MATRTTVFRMGRKCRQQGRRLWDFASKDASRIFSSTSRIPETPEASISGILLVEEKILLAFLFCWPCAGS